LDSFLFLFEIFSSPPSQLIFFKVWKCQKVCLIPMNKDESETEQLWLKMHSNGRGDYRLHIHSFTQFYSMNTREYIVQINIEEVHLQSFKQFAKKASTTWT
jgi:hypothetical protein